MAISKPKLLQTLTPLSFMALFLILANKAHSQDVTSFTFDTFPQNPKDLTYQGDARVLSGSTVLSLAGTDASGAPMKESVGRVLYSKPVKFWERSPARQATFETTIRFLIKPSRNGAAEGIAFFIAPVGTTIPPGSVGGNLGIFNSSHASSLFAVEFDTNYNGWDPTYHHIGININARASSNVSRFDSGTGQMVTARINYNSNTKTISVVATSGSQISELSYVYDLKSILDEEVQVGITSSTGWYISAVGLPDIHSWYFTSSLVLTNDVNDNSENDEKYIRQYVSV